MPIHPRLRERQPYPSEVEQAQLLLTRGRNYERCGVCWQIGWFYNWEYRPDEITDGIPGRPCWACGGKGWK